MGMYDKLGDLLSETLEAGKVKFIRVEKKDIPPKKEEKLSEKAKSFFTRAQNENEGEKNASEASEENARRIKEEREKKIREQMEKDRQSFGAYVGPRSGTIYHANEYKAVTPETEAAFKFLGLSTSAGEAEIKSAYREKLSFYHPDHNTASEVLQKVAGDKTRQLIDAYRKALAFCNQ